MVLSDKYGSFFFFLVANYLWTDCDRTNKLADYSRRFYILKHYFKLRPLANYSLAIHVNYSHCNWQFLSVLLKHHLMWLCEFFIADHFYESIFTVIYRVWIFTCMSNCETPLLWMLLLTFFFLLVTWEGIADCCQRLKICNPCNRWAPRVSGILWRQTSTVLFPSSIVVQAIWFSLKAKSLENWSCHFAEIIVVKETLTNYLFHTLHPASYCACCGFPWKGRSLVLQYWLSPGRAGASAAAWKLLLSRRFLAGSHPTWLKWDRIRGPWGVKAPSRRWGEDIGEGAPVTTLPAAGKHWLWPQLPVWTARLPWKRPGSSMACRRLPLQWG